MVKIPARPFIMGSDSGARDEHPAHSVYLNGFWMDRHEVTTAEWNAYAQAMNLPLRSAPDDHPIISVGWPDALAYCQWVGKRLPTEAEWEKAARGTDGRTYPWGEGMERTRANYGTDVCCDVDASDGYSLTSPVGHYPQGESPYGVRDMAGNVWEWVADWYDATYYARSPRRNPQGPSTGTRRVIRSSGWQVETPQVRIFTRVASNPLDRNHSTGFRCAVTLPTS